MKNQRSAKVIQEKAGWRVECREHGNLLHTLYFDLRSEVLALSRAEMWIVAGVALPVSYSLPKKDVGCIDE
ncbi:hypothetical protein [Neisseria sicca]|uniref:hypothetical protein n=1 Tax=Neisseria sicca TaxID=490 RepID=UPI003C770184